MSPASRSNGTARLALIAGLILATVAVYWPVVGFGFTGLDDPQYVTSNPQVLMGVSFQGIRWAFSSFEAANWHPLTWLSLMLDSSIGGGAPWVYHTTNLLLHVLNTLLLFLALDRMTRRPGRSAFVALLFAIHPQHVESVAWVAERKDVLSTAFFLLTILAYIRYAARSSTGRYVLVALAFAFGLLAKPMLVTLPLVLLLLDFWPLERFRNAAWPLVREKLPLLAMAAASSAITVVAQSRGGAVASLEIYPLWARAANAVVAYATYLLKALWPSGLTVVYPHPGTGIGAMPVLVSACALVLLTILSLRAFRTRPYLTFGWLWYLVTLLPVIGIVQVGMQSRADRYTYIPLIGIFLAVTWLGAEALGRAHRAPDSDARRADDAGARHRPPPSADTTTGQEPDRAGAAVTAHSPWTAVVMPALAGALVLPLMVAAHLQVNTWRDRHALFAHLAEVDPGRADGHNTLGSVLLIEGANDEAKKHFLRAIELDPRHAGAHNNLGNILFNEGSLEEAMVQFRRTIALDPRHAGAHNNLAVALERTGKPADAVREFQEAIRINPFYAEAHEHLAQLLLSGGRASDAVPHFSEALRLEPRLATAHAGLASALVETGDPKGAILHAREALELEPRLLQPHITLGAALMLQSDFSGAVTQFAQAVAIDPTLVDAHANLAGALLQQGRTEDAIKECREAIRLLPEHTGARTNLALALLKQGNRDAARKELAEVLRLDPNDVRARRYLQQIAGSR